MDLQIIFLRSFEGTQLSALAHVFPIQDAASDPGIALILAADAVMAIIMAAVYVFLSSFKGKLFSPTGYYVLLSGAFIAQSISLYATGANATAGIAENVVTLMVLTATYAWLHRREQPKPAR